MRTSAYWVVLAAAFAAPPRAVPQMTQPAFALALTAPHSVAQSGHEVRVEINASVARETIFLQNLGCRQEMPYSFDVLGSRGEAPPRSRYLKLLKGADTSRPMEIITDSYRCWIPVRAHLGDMFHESVDLSALYDLREPDTYTVQVSRPDDGAIMIKSNILSITVTPPTSSQPAPPNARAPFSLTIWLNRPKLSDPFVLDVITRNTSDHPISFDTAQDYKDLLGSVYKVDLVDANGNPPPETNLSRSVKNRNGNPPSFTLSASQAFDGRPNILKPGEEWHDPIHVGYLYTLRQPGEYTIQVRRWENQTKTWVRSNAITDTYAP